MTLRARIVSNFGRGTITDDPLTSGATTINSDGFASLSAIGTGGYARITIDPGDANEVCDIVAHTASATSVTVVRPNPVEHAAGTTWLLGHYAEFEPLTGDDTWGGDDVLFAEEFDGEATTDLPSGAAWLNQGGTTFLRKFGRGVLTIPTSSATLAVRGIEWDLPSNPTSWLLMAKISVLLVTADHHALGLHLRDSTSGRIEGITTRNSVSTLGWSVKHQSYSSVTAETTPSTLSQRHLRPPAGRLLLLHPQEQRNVLRLRNQRRWCGRAAHCDRARR